MKAQRPAGGSRRAGAWGTAADMVAAARLLHQFASGFSAHWSWADMLPVQRYGWMRGRPCCHAEIQGFLVACVAPRRRLPPAPACCCRHTAHLLLLQQPLSNAQRASQKREHTIGQGNDLVIYKAMRGTAASFDGWFRSSWCFAKRCMQGWWSGKGPSACLDGMNSALFALGSVQWKTSGQGSARRQAGMWKTIGKRGEEDQSCWGS